MARASLSRPVGSWVAAVAAVRGSVHVADSRRQHHPRVHPLLV